MTDAEKIHSLEAACFSDPWSLTAVENQLKSGNGLWLITEENGIPCGYALGSIVCGEAELYRIAVSDNFRRKGLGEKLLTDFIEKCRSMEAEKYSLKCVQGIFLQFLFTKRQALRKSQSARATMATTMQ